MSTPIVPNGLVVLEYAIVGVVHHHRLRCNIQNPSAGSGYVLDLFGGGTIAWEPAVDLAGGVLETFYNASTTFSNWTLYVRSGSNYIPLDTHASGLTGTNAGANEACGQATLTMKDAANKVVKLVLMESSFVPPDKANTNAYMADCINTGSSHVGGWLQGRNGTPPTRQIAIVVTLNRKLRRRRGLA